MNSINSTMAASNLNVFCCKPVTYLIMSPYSSEKRFVVSQKGKIFNRFASDSAVERRLFILSYKLLNT
jgi:hypothetical protein